MKTVKKSIILCLCAALLLTPLLTACDLFNDIETQDTQEAVTEPALQDCGHEPYRIEAKDGQAEIIFDPCYTKPFVLEIPETGEDGIPVREIRTNTIDIYHMLPGIMSEEDFLVFQGKLEEYYGVTLEEIKENPQHENAFYLNKILCYFMRRALDDFTDDRIKADLLEAYPIIEKMDIYVLDHSVNVEEMLRLYAVAHNAAPELDDVWYNEAAARAELDYRVAVCDQMTEIRWSSNLEKIDAFTFIGGNQTTVTVPGTVKTVEYAAFACNSKLEEITFEEGVTSISREVLYGSNHVKTINLPASLEVLGQFNQCVFGYDSEIPTINYAGTMAQWKELLHFEEIIGNHVLSESYECYRYFDIHCSDGVVQATKTLN